MALILYIGAKQIMLFGLYILCIYKFRSINDA